MIGKRGEEIWGSWARTQPCEVRKERDCACEVTGCVKYGEGAGENMEGKAGSKYVLHMGCGVGERRGKGTMHCMCLREEEEEVE